MSVDIVDQINKEYIEWLEIFSARNALKNLLKINDKRSTYELDNIIGRWSITSDNVNSKIMKDFVNKKFISELVEKHLVTIDQGNNALDYFIHRIQNTCDNFPRDVPRIYDNTVSYKKFRQKLNPVLISRLRQKATDEQIIRMILRYAKHFANGMQWSVPQEVLFYLHDNFDVDCECFASPLNAILPRFGSLYLDTDGVFGSIGDFFSQKFDAGNYTINPPFIEPILNQCISKLLYDLRLADTQNKGIRVFCFIPEWRDSNFFQQFMRTPYRVYTETLYRGKHFYNSDERQVIATFNSAFFVLQNKHFVRKSNEPDYSTCCQNMIYNKI